MRNTKAALVIISLLAVCVVALNGVMITWRKQVHQQARVVEAAHEASATYSQSVLRQGSELLIDQF